MTMKRTGLLALALLAATAFTSVAEARSLKWARSGDALTMDPHAQNEGPTTTLAHQIYEPLVTRSVDGSLMPTLATEWRVLPADPTIWEFKLRPGVKFHNGADFTADDAVFSIQRAMSANSDFKGLWAGVEGATKVDALTVHVKTKGPNPTLIQNLTNTMMMSKSWSEANNVVGVQDFKNKEETFAVRNANGTGAFSLVSREADVKTVMKRNDTYWGRGQVPMEVTEIIYTPIKADATRLAALLAGEVDVVHDVPVQDIQRLKTTPTLRVNEGPENRTIFLGMNVVAPELKSSDIKGKNPFADKKVRQAMSIALNRDAIQRIVMRGQSRPSGTIAPPFITGYTAEMGVPPKFEPAKAKAMIAEAGYPNGFSATMHCPNDRYVNDEGICQAVVGMLGAAGIKVNLVSHSKTLHFPMIQKTPPETEFFLLGWGVPPFDSDYVFSFLYHSRQSPRGGWNATGYSNPEMDKKIQSLSSETDQVKRNATIAEIWKVFQDETIYVPIHDQMIAYAMKNDIDIPVHPDNTMWMKFVTFKRS
jgi:peptide/nickel transport system substrate-binding protein